MTKLVVGSKINQVIYQSCLLASSSFGSKSWGPSFDTNEPTKTLSDAELIKTRPRNMYKTKTAALREGPKYWQNRHW